jgi:hypothetical protein
VFKRAAKILSFARCLGLYSICVSTGLLGGCATSASKAIVEKYNGKTGHFSAFPTGVVSIGHNYSYKICDQSKIVKIEQLGVTKYVYFEQNSRLYRFEVINQDDSDVEFLNKYFVSTLNLPKQMINLKSGSMQAKKAVCDGILYVGMAAEHFLIVNGLPEKINRTVTAGLETVQLVYRKKGAQNQFDRNYFYFTNGILKSWQD